MIVNSYPETRINTILLHDHKIKYIYSLALALYIQKFINDYYYYFMLSTVICKSLDLA